MASSQDAPLINRDMQLDQNYLAGLGLSDKESLWRRFYEEQFKHNAEKGSV